MADAELKNQIASWLSQLDVEQWQSSASAERLATSGSDCILSKPAFNRWSLGATRTNVISATGLPGSGKTACTSAVVSHLRDNVAKVMRDTAIAFLYCGDIKEGELTAHTLLLCLCAQLVRQSTTMTPLLLKLHQEAGSQENGQQKTVTPDIDNIMLVIMALVGNFRRVYICVDALEKCPRAGERPMLLQKLQWMANRGTRLFLTSQTHSLLPGKCKCHDDIDQAFLDISQPLVIQARYTDIISSTRAYLDAIPEAEEVLDKAGCRPDDAVKEAAAESGDMYLMAHLKLQRRIRLERQSINDTGVSGKMRRVSVAPSYRTNHLLDPILGDTWPRRYLALKSLSWLLHAAETMTLNDFVAGLATDLQDTIPLQMWLRRTGRRTAWGYELDFWVRPVDATLHVGETQIQGSTSRAVEVEEGTWLCSDLCRGLVQVDYRQETQEFYVVLTGDVQLSAVTEDREIVFPDAHGRMALVCLRYLRKQIPDSSTRTTNQPREPWAPSKSYAQAHWVKHFKMSRNDGDNLDLTKSAADYLQHLYEVKPCWIEKRTFFGTSPASEYAILVTDNETPVLKAARLGLSSVLKCLLERDCHDVDASSYKRETAMSVAVQAGHTMAVQLLLQHGASMQYRNDSGESLLHLAAEKNDEVMVALLIEYGLDKNTRIARDPDRLEGTALHTAATKGSPEAAEMLLRYGVDMYVEDWQGTAMDEAVGKGNLDMVKLLVRHGHNLSETALSSRHNLLWTAAREGSTSVVEYLLSSRTWIDSLDDSGRVSIIHDAVRKGDVGLIELLLKHLDDPLLPYKYATRGISASSAEGETAVEAAIKAKEIGMAKYLVSQIPSHVPSDNMFSMAAAAFKADEFELAKTSIEKAEPPLTHVRQRCEDTIMGAAVSKTPDRGILELLLQRGMSPLTQDDEGISPLHLALGRPDAVRLLLRHGADINANTSSGATPLHLAATNWKGAMASFHLVLASKPDLAPTASDGSTAFLAAGIAKNFTQAFTLLKHGANVNATDRNGRTILHYAVEHADLSFLKTVLNHGVDIDAFADDVGTALHFASYVGRKEVVKLLLDRGASLNLPLDPLYRHPWRGPVPTKSVPWSRHLCCHMEKGWKPLHSAACAGHTDIINLLILSGSDVSVRANYNEAPIHIAASAAKTDAVRCLVRHGADVNDKSGFGDTPLHFATAAEILISTRAASNAGQCACKLHGEAAQALARADRSSHVECVTALIALGADKAATNKRGVNPMAVALSNGHDDIVNLFLSNNAPTLDSASYIKLLDTCARNLQLYWHTEGKKELVYRTRSPPSASWLERVTRGAPEDYNSSMEWYEVLASACLAGVGPMVNLALSKGAKLRDVLHLKEPVFPRPPPQNPLHHVIIDQRDDILDALLLGPSGVDGKPKAPEDTPASTNPSGANLFSRDAQGRHVIHLACMPLINKEGALTVRPASAPNKERILSTLLTAGGIRLINACTADTTRNTPLHLAAASGQPGLISILLRNGADINIRNGHGQTPLHSAASAWVFAEVVELLLQSGACAAATDKKGNTPAHLIRDATKAGVEGVRLLVQHYHSGGTPAVPLYAIRNRNGDMPIHMAARRGNWLAMRALMDAGARVGDKGAKGRTALHVAAAKGRWNMVRELVAMGADIQAVDGDGLTAGEVAKKGGHEEVVKLLDRLGNVTGRTRRNFG
ncbi:ankyrin repeat-containing domain protein [Podospora aff. communis PSN243]|uniref:Ankyrin repeat-containing domain protein n=1 Tax=Podospora aff. communis PSN243 TaxID=3040156 RepID=A0AAV9G9B2_9PEZI|nr:ankyrin repeat-containing domain protein [Podospora aff. communis PSN243]